MGSSAEQCARVLLGLASACAPPRAAPRSAPICPGRARRLAGTYRSCLLRLPLPFVTSSSRSLAREPLDGLDGCGRAMLGSGRKGGAGPGRADRHFPWRAGCRPCDLPSNAPPCAAARCARCGLALHLLGACSLQWQQHTVSGGFFVHALVLYRVCYGSLVIPCSRTHTRRKNLHLL